MSSQKSLLLDVSKPLNCFFNSIILSILLLLAFFSAQICSVGCGFSWPGCLIRHSTCCPRRGAQLRPLAAAACAVAVRETSARSLSAVKLPWRIEGEDMEETGGASAYGVSLAGKGFDFNKFVRQPLTVVRVLSWVSESTHAENSAWATTKCGFGFRNAASDRIFLKSDP